MSRPLQTLVLGGTKIAMHQLVLQPDIKISFVVILNEMKPSRLYEETFGLFLGWKGGLEKKPFHHFSLVPTFCSGTGQNDTSEPLL